MLICILKCIQTELYISFVQVPTQNNKNDCGNYVLTYIQKFVSTVKSDGVYDFVSSRTLHFFQKSCIAVVIQVLMLFFFLNVADTRLVQFEGSPITQNDLRVYAFEVNKEEGRNWQAESFEEETREMNRENYWEMQCKKPGKEGKSQHGEEGDNYHGESEYGRRQSQTGDEGNLEETESEGERQGERGEEGNLEETESDGERQGERGGRGIWRRPRMMGRGKESMGGGGIRAEQGGNVQAAWEGGGQARKVWGGGELEECQSKTSQSQNQYHEETVTLRTYRRMLQILLSTPHPVKILDNTPQPPTTQQTHYVLRTRRGRGK